MVRAKRIIHMPTGPDYYGSMNGRLVAAFAAMSVDNDLAVILITGHGDIAMAVNVMREVQARHRSTDRCGDRRDRRIRYPRGRFHDWMHSMLRWSNTAAAKCILAVGYF
jgi:hypothetical protein